MVLILYCNFTALKTKCTWDKIENHCRILYVRRLKTYIKARNVVPHFFQGRNYYFLFIFICLFFQAECILLQHIFVNMLTQIVQNWVAQLKKIALRVHLHYFFNFF